MAYSSTAAYNAASRHIEMLLEIYFEEVPVSITRDNYLVSFSLLEEAVAGDNIFSGASSNEITIQLHSPEGIFNPVNTNSPYYGLIKRGIKIIPKVRADALDDWMPLGTFFVTSWKASMTGSTASIVANDCLYSLFNDTSVVTYRPKENISVKDFWKALLSSLSTELEIDDLLTDILPVAYMDAPPKSVIQHLNNSFVTTCNAGHNGHVMIRRAYADRAIKYVLTDSDQVLKVNSSVTTETAYKSALLHYTIPTISDIEKLYSDSSYDALPGKHTIECILEKKPLCALASISFSSKETLASITDIKCTPTTASFMLGINGGIVSRGALSIQGTYVSTRKCTMGDEGAGALSVEASYAQTKEQASKVYTIMQQLVTEKIPVISVDIRGNPNIEIGDRLSISSAHFHIYFSGIVLRQEIKYNGGLTSNLLIMNANILGG